MYDALGSLTDRQRLIIHMRYFDGMKERRIAQLLGITNGTVSITLKRAENRMRKFLYYNCVTK